MEIKKLKDLCEIRGRIGWKGYTVEDLRDEGPLVIGANDITSSNMLNLDNVKHLSREKYEESPEIFLKKNDILVVKVGSTIGKVCIIDEDVGEATINPNCVIVRCIDINPYYLYLYLCSSNGKNYLINNSSASGQPALNQKDLGEMPINVINEKKQVEICQTIYNIITKIKLNKQINLELECLAKTIYDYWFLQFEFPNEEGKPYKSSGGKMVWNDELKREIPEGWNTCTVQDITICHDSKRIPLSSKERENKKGLYPYYGATEVMDYVDNYIFEGDYILLAEDGSIMDKNGNPIIQRIYGKTWVNNHAHVLEPKAGYSPYLLFMVLKNIPVIQIKTGSIQMKINQKNLNNYKVLNIPNDILKKVNIIYNNIDKKIINLKNENQQLESLRDFLLPLLMNGQVTFKKDDEHA